MADYFIGEIRPFAFAFPTVDFMLCNGQELLISQYPALAALIGNKFGGDGRTTFKLPTIQGQIIIGSGAMPGGQTYLWGQVGGQTDVTLTSLSVPSHTHDFNGVSAGAAGVSITAEANGPGATGTSALSNFVSKTAAGANVPNTLAYAHTTTETVELAPNSILPVGSNGSHSNMAPYVTISYAICVSNGDWPSRD